MRIRVLPKIKLVSTAAVAFAAVIITSLTLMSCGGGSSNSSNTSTGPTLTSVGVTPITPSVNVGGTQQFTATATYSDNSTQDVTTLATWTSSSTSVATVETIGQASPGLATAIKTGTSSIEATYQGHAGSTTMIVSVAPVLTSLSISPTGSNMNVGATLQFNATAGYSDGSTQIVTSSAAWSSSDSTIVSIQTSGTSGQITPGLASGAQPGNVNITATYGGIAAVTTLNVVGTGGTLTSFNIGQLNPSIAPGATLQLFSYAQYSDGTQEWVSSNTGWSSSNQSVATIQDISGASPGLAAATTTAGTTVITATFGGMTATTNLTVAANAVTVDLMDMTSSENYLSFSGGLYENGNTVPASHDTDGRTAAAAVQPLNQSGSPKASGAIVFLGIGMSNATEEFSDFINVAASTSGVNHSTLAMEDGATGAATACYWTVATGNTGVCPGAQGVLLDNQYDRVRDTVLATATTAPSAPAGCGGPPNPTPCLTEAQVQVLWIKNANPRPGISNYQTLCDPNAAGCSNSPLTTEAYNYEAQLGEIVRAAKSRYPNLQEVFVSSRIYAGYATVGLSPEPYAYEYGLSAKWLIEAQIQQELTGTIDPIAGDMSYTDGTAAWTAWGYYIWADGTTADSDGLFYVVADFQSDGTHPSASGVTKVVNQLMDFYTTSPYTTWFVSP